MVHTRASLLVQIYISSTLVLSSKREVFFACHTAAPCRDPIATPRYKSGRYWQSFDQSSSFHIFSHSCMLGDVTIHCQAPSTHGELMKTNSTEP